MSGRGRGQSPANHDAVGIGFIDAAPEGALAGLLCQPDSVGACQFPSEVMLEANLDCAGRECDVDTVRQVRVVTAEETVFYEYQPAPCVAMAFYEGPEQLRLGGANWIMCADPTLATGGAVCCNSPTTTKTPGLALCEYQRERLTFAAAKQRCEAMPHVEVLDVPTWADIYAPVPTGPAPQFFVAKDPAGAGGEALCAAETKAYDVRCCADAAVDGFAQPQGFATAEVAANVALGRPATQSSLPVGFACARVARFCIIARLTCFLLILAQCFGL